MAEHRFRAYLLDAQNILGISCFGAFFNKLLEQMNVVRALSSEGHGRIACNKSVLDQLHSVSRFRLFFENGNADLARFCPDHIRQDLGEMWQWLLPDAMHHSRKAYLHSMTTEGHAEPSYQGGER